MAPIYHSLIIAFAATLLAFCCMLPVALRHVYHPYKGQAFVECFLLLPLVLPPTVVGLVLLNLFGKYGFIGQLLARINDYSLIFTLTGATLATFIVILPIMYQALKSALLTLNPDYLAAAKTLGASRFEQLFKIILPNCWQGLFIGILLAFCRGLGEFGATLMVAGYIEGKTDTIASGIYFALQQGDPQQAIFLSIIDVIIGVSALLLIQLFLRQSSAHKGASFHA